MLRSSIGKLRFLWVLGIISLSLPLTSSAATNVEGDSPEKSGALIWSSKACSDLLNGQPTSESGVLAAILAAVVPKAVDLGLSLLSDKLKASAKSYEVSYLSTIVDDWGMAFRQKEGVVAHRYAKRCIVFHAGDSGPWEKGIKVKGQNKQEVADALIEKTEEVKNFYPPELRELPYKPKFFLVAEMNYQPIGKRGITAYIKPIKIAVNGALASGKGPKDLVVSFKLKVPKVVSGESYEVNVAIPPFKNIQPGYQRSLESSYSQVFSVPIVKLHDGEEEVRIPATLEAALIATDKGLGSKIYSTIAEAVDENKDKLTESIVLKILPEDEQESSDE